MMFVRKIAARDLSPRNLLSSRQQAGQAQARGSLILETALPWFERLLGVAHCEQPDLNQVHPS